MKFDEAMSIGQVLTSEEMNAIPGGLGSGSGSGSGSESGSGVCGCALQMEDGSTVRLDNFITESAQACEDACWAACGEGCEAAVFSFHTDWPM